MARDGLSVGVKLEMRQQATICVRSMVTTIVHVRFVSRVQIQFTLALPAVDVDLWYTPIVTASWITLRMAVGGKELR